MLLFESSKNYCSIFVLFDHLPDSVRGQLALMDVDLLSWHIKQGKLWCRVVEVREPPQRFRDVTLKIKIRITMEIVIYKLFRAGIDFSIDVRIWLSWQINKSYQEKNVTDRPQSAGCFSNVYQNETN